MDLPRRDLARELRLARDPHLGLAALRDIEHAEHVLGREDAAVGRCRGDVVGSAHRSRHAFSLISPRRIQLLTVPIGVWLRVARFS